MGAFSGELSIAGILGGRGPILRDVETADSTPSDIDLLLVMDRGTPSAYFRLCTAVCQEILRCVAPAFVFASFRQQVLLYHLATTRRCIPIHLLQYLDAGHLFAREQNTLPLTIPSVLQPLAGMGGDLAELVKAGSTKVLNRTPKAQRARYYADVAYEALPLFVNFHANVLPYAVLAEEAVHKLRFVARHLLRELSIPWSEDSTRTETLQGTAMSKEKPNAEVFVTLLELGNLDLSKAASMSAPLILELFRRLFLVLDFLETPLLAAEVE